MSLLAITGTTVIVLASIPALFLLLQVCASFGYRPLVFRPPPALKFAILVPAHDEERVIEATLRSIQAELQEGGRLLVVAHNCSDRTAALAEMLGAEVLQKTEEQQRGKGFALAAGIEHLDATGAPEVLIVIDADCRVNEGGLARVAAMAAAHRRPAQAAYLIQAPPGAEAGIRIAELAVKVRNYVRPLGSRRLGLPVPIRGSGFAVPWEMVDGLAVGSSSIVEDFEAGIRFAAQGHAPIFVPETIIRSPLPLSREARASQQRRWEHGVVASTFQFLPRLLWMSIRRRDLRLFGLCLDISVPPLSMFALIALILLLVAFGFFALESAILPLVAATVLAGSLALAIAICVIGYGLDIVSAKDLLGIPSFAVTKIRHAAAFVAGRRIGWVRTERD